MSELRLEYIPANELIPNPDNWKHHPKEQIESFEAVFQQVGWADALLLNETTGLLVDGHLRQKVFFESNDLVPVLIGNWTPEQEKLILVTFDPLAAMAESDNDQLSTLLADIQTNSPDIDKMLAKLAEDNGLWDGDSDNDTDDAINGKFKSLTLDLKKQVRPIIEVQDITPFELAIMKTGIRNRGKAIIFICQYFLDEKR